MYKLQFNWPSPSYLLPDSYSLVVPHPAPFPLSISRSCHVFTKQPRYGNSRGVLSVFEHLKRSVVVQRKTESAKCSSRFSRQFFFFLKKNKTKKSYYTKFPSVMNMLYTKQHVLLGVSKHGCWISEKTPVRLNRPRPFPTQKIKKKKGKKGAIKSHVQIPQRDSGYYSPLPAAGSRSVCGLLHRQ